MGLDIFGQSAEVEQFLKDVEEGKKPKNFGKFVKNHSFKDNKLKVLNHYFMIINIPEKMSEHFDGVEVPVPRFGRQHKGVTGFGAWSKKSDFLKLFPKSTVQDIRCTGDDTCIVCERIAEHFDRLGIEKVNKKWMAPETLSPDDKSIADQLIGVVDGGMRGKKKVVFAAIVFERDKDNKKQWNKSIERFVMSDFYWTRDFEKVLFESRAEDKEEWLNEDHCDDVYAYNEMSKALCEYTEEEQNQIFLLNTESTVPIPWDMLDGAMIHYEEVGEVQELGTVTVKKNFPYFPPQLIKSAKGEAKKTLKAREAKAKETYDFIIENIETLKDLDINGYFPAKITREEQIEILGVGKETKKTMSDEIDTKSETVTNVFSDEAETDDVGDIGEGVEESKPASDKPAGEQSFGEEDFPF